MPGQTLALSYGNRIQPLPTLAVIRAVTGQPDTSVCSHVIGPSISAGHSRLVVVQLAFSVYASSGSSLPSPGP
jgi:hypothetical protein